jgi:hypothetical protein
MDFIKQLMETNNINSLNEISKQKFIIENDDSEQDIIIIQNERQKFINHYNKRNNRQFIKMKHFDIHYYNHKLMRFEKNF